MSASRSCQQCGKELAPEGVFCPFCGSRQDVPSQEDLERVISSESLEESKTLIDPAHLDTIDTPSRPIDALTDTENAGQTSEQTPLPKDSKPPPLGILEPGTILGQHYEIVSKVGEGGMGVVYKASENHGASGCAACHGS